MVSSSPGLAVAPTQNTAAVVRFRCLYTHDLRRKAKRWQDGYLRYHTFNKRIMVFDEPGNFIGDKHWRQDEMIQDGDEFELDKGVLVQVAESMEKTETDLTPLFETRKASQGSPSQPSSSQQTKRVPVRSAVPSSQQSSSSQSRSLNDLLGIKRTPVERLKSPYEQRQASQASRPVVNPQPGANSQPGVNLQPGVSPRPAPNPRPGVNPRPAAFPQPTANPATNNTLAQERPVSKPPAPKKPIPKTAAQKPAQKPAPKDKQPVVIDLSEPSVNDEPSPPVQAPPRKARKTLPQTTKPDLKSHSFSGNPQQPVSSPAAPSSTAPSEPRSTLQLPKSKPRKKLMYQALLPGQKRMPNPSSTSAESQNPGRPTNSPGISTLDALEVNSTGNPMSTNSLNPDNSTLDVLAGNEITSTGDLMSTDSIRPGTSTLDALANESNPDGNPDNRLLPEPEPEPERQPQPVNDNQSDTSDIGNSTLDILVSNDPDPDPDPDPNPNPNPNPDTTNDDPDPDPDPTEAMAMAMVPGASTQNILADIADDTISISDSDSNSDSRTEPPQRNLQKTHSDPSAFLTVGGTSLPRTLALSSCPEEPGPMPIPVSCPGPRPDDGQNHVQVQDQGPWTCEAMDLFDFWPPGRLKQPV